MTFDRLWESTKDGPRLVGGRSKQTGKIIFPCPMGSEAERYDPVLLQTEGKLWSYTVQRFPPKNPPYLGVTKIETFQPFAVGYIELEGEVIVEARIATEDFESLRLGKDMRLEIIEIEKADGGDPIKTFGFAPF